MHFHRGRPSLWFILLLTLMVPGLAACGEREPSPVMATTATNLPQAVEDYMSSLPGASPKLFLTTRVTDRHGVLLGEFWDEGRRYWTPISRISESVRKATVATEDKTFYSNPGVDFQAVGRAAVQNAGSSGLSGASTITQQLARNIFMPYEKRLEQSIDRKVTEAMLAQDLAQRFSKDEVLEMYLNVVNYGHLAYGIEAAARTYFGKSAADLTLAEGALLAGLPQSPANLDPLVPDNLETARARQELVLALMVKNEFITQAEADDAMRQSLNFRSVATPLLAPHFLNYVRQYLIDEYGEEAATRSGWTVTTSLDLGLQRTAEDIVRKQVDQLRNVYNLKNAALVSIRPKSGEIVAMVGSADYYNTQIAGQVNVTVSRRQPGSAIKPVLYATAFSAGLNPADLVWDIPVDYVSPYGQVYSPVNYDGKFHGPIRIRTALSNSYNIPAVKTLALVGIPALVENARRMGIEGFDKPADQYGLSITLGGVEVTQLSLTSAFGTIANGGLRVAPDPILSITGPAGEPIQHKKQNAERVLDPRVAFLVTSILTDNEARVPAFGANSPLHLSRTAGAKTGTTTDWRDNWTVGFTPYVVTGVWAGNSDGSPMVNTTGLTGAAPIWHDFMEAIFAKPELEAVVHGPGESSEFARPDGLLEGQTCVLSTLKYNGTCSSSRTELYIDPSRPITIGVPSTISHTLTTNPATTPTGDPAFSQRFAVRMSTGQVCAGTQGTQKIQGLHLPATAKEALAAWSWASRSGIPVEPMPCDSRVVLPAAAPAVTEGTISVAITSPPTGLTVKGDVDVLGTATFSLQNAQFYKVEYGSGANPSRWITIGSGHPESVSGGRLETWRASSLPPGTYALRVVVVKKDGNFVASPPVTVNLQR
jgi:1A family penicillin-binding protein